MFSNLFWARGKKADVKPTRLLVQREKFAKRVMVSAGVCFGGKGRLHFVQEKAKVDCAYYVGQLLPNLVDDCNHLLPTGFVFQQDGAPAHTARSQVSRFCCKGSVASKFAGSKPVSYTHLTLPTILRV